MPRTIAAPKRSTADVTDAQLQAVYQRLNSTLNPFNRVSQALTDIGALSIESYLSKSSGLEDLDVAFHLQVPQERVASPPRVSQPQQTIKRSSSQSPPVLKDASDSAPVAQLSTVRGVPSKRDYSPITVLHQTCQRAFGTSVNFLTFEFLEDNPQCKQCILTIKRPNGASRSYKTEAVFKKRADAKSEVCGMAIDRGALDFILTGESEVLKAKKGDVDGDSLSGGVVPVLQTLPTPKESEPVKIIEDCCAEWRAGKVKPHWVSLGESKVGHGVRNRYGAALRISLTPHAFRAYSTGSLYASRQEAKAVCAKIALEEGVLEYIKHGNGQTERPKTDNGSDSVKEENVTPEPEAGALSLQEFYESLPQPFPEPVGDKTAYEINGPAWLNTALQTTRGARLMTTFTWITNSSQGVNGCLLRVDRPGESKTYIVDPRFVKRADAKSAVCLLAMSQGLGDYIRSVKQETEQRLSPERRKLAHDKIIPSLTAECNKVRCGNRMVFDFVQERDAFGCTAKIDISPYADQPDVREYSVESMYRNKVDSKLAAVCVAAEQGVYELLKFRGGAQPPPGYRTFWEAITNKSGKRKGPDGDADTEDHERKKRRRNNRGSMEQGEVVDAEVEMAPAKASELEPSSRTPATSSNSIKLEGSVAKDPWKVPRGSVTTVPTSARGSTPTGSTSQGRSDNRNVGGTSGKPDGHPSHPGTSRRHPKQQQQQLPPRPEPLPYDGPYAGPEKMHDRTPPPPARHPPAALYAAGPYGGHQVPYSSPPPVHGHPYIAPPPYYAALTLPTPYTHPPYGYYPQPLGAPPGSYPMHPAPPAGYAPGYAPSVGPMPSPSSAAGLADPYSLGPHSQVYPAYGSPQAHPQGHFHDRHNRSMGRGYERRSQKESRFVGGKRGRYAGQRF